MYLTLYCFAKVGQIRTLPFGLWTGTISAHHSVGAVTGEMKHCYHLTFYLWNQWMWNLSGIVDTERLSIRVKCYVASSLKLPQSAEGHCKFGFEICPESLFDTGSPK